MHSFHRHTHKQSVIVPKHERAKTHVYLWSLAVVVDDIYITVIYEKCNLKKKRVEIFARCINKQTFSQFILSVNHIQNHAATGHVIFAMIKIRIYKLIFFKLKSYF